jgi:hypothetical protein
VYKFFLVRLTHSMAIRVKQNKFNPKTSSKLQNTYFRPATLNTKKTKYNGFKARKSSDLLSKIILPLTLLFSFLSMLLIFLPGIFNIKTTAKASPNKDSVRIVTNYTYTTKPNLEKIVK